MKRIRGFGWAVVAVLMVTVLVGTFLLGRAWNADAESSDAMVTRIQKLGELVVLRVNVADVVEAEGYDYKGLWVVRGDALVAVDLRKAELVSADEDAKKLVVRLPQPRVIQPRVDHERTRTYDISKTTWVPFVGDRDKLADEGLRKAQRIVEKQSTGNDIMQQARDQAELMLSDMYRFVGWEIEVVWQGGAAS